MHRCKFCIGAFYFEKNKNHIYNKRRRIIIKKEYKDFLELIMSKLIEFYNLTLQKAESAVQNSGAKKMLTKESTANWQMHQPLMFTVEQVYCEYMGFEVPI